MMESRVLVVGAGAIGLRTAVELLRRNHRVLLRAPVHPLHSSVCSQGAGGLWMPYHCDDPRTDRWALETLDELWNFAKNGNSNNSLVEIVPAISLKHDNQATAVFMEDTKSNLVDASKLPAWTRDPRLSFQQLTVEMLHWQNDHVHRYHLPPGLFEAGYKHAWLFQTPVVDTPKMLESLLDEVKTHTNTDSVDVETGDFYQSVSELQQLARDNHCNAVINCTGLASRTICQDDQMVGARGVLIHVDRATCVRRPPQSTAESNDNEPPLPPEKDVIVMCEHPPWGSETGPCYIIPRGNIIAVGGTYLEGDSRETLREAERQQLIQNATLMGLDMEQSKIVGEWTGFRPYRRTVRCEEERVDDEATDVRVVHCYGHGGSGWTVNVGAAKDVAKILESPSK